MQRRGSLQLDFNRVKPLVANQSSPRDVGDAVSWQSRGLSPRQLMGPAFSLNIFHMTVEGIVRDDAEGKPQVFFAVSPLLLAQLRIEGTEEEIFSSWPDSLVRRATDVSGHSFILSKPGLLRLIAIGTSPKALDILTQVAEGLMQFHSAEKVVLSSERTRREELAEIQKRRSDREATALEEWKTSMRAKKEERQVRRKTGMTPMLMRAADNAVSAPAIAPSPEPVARSPSPFRQMIRAGSEKRLSDLVLQRTAVEKLKTIRRTAEMESIPQLPDRPIEADQTEAVVDISTSYLQQDPTRVMKDVPAPTPVLLTVEQVYSGKNGTPAMTLLGKHFAREGRLEPSAARRLLNDCAKLLKEEPNCVEIEAPCHIFGDIHGQLFDMLEIIKKAGSPLETKQLWMGDYVDRGSFGCEVVLMLAAAKIKWPKNVYLLRGNHESRSMAGRYNFEREALSKYGHVFEDFMLCFDNLPLAAVVASGHGRIFCVHGGLSPTIRSPSDVERIERFEEPPHWGPACDLLWSDPMDEAAVTDKAKFAEEYYEDNLSRGCGQMFGPAAVKDFLDDNEMVCIVRAHEVQKEGWKAHRFFHEERPVPMVLTVFSAPNYCGTYENKGAFLTVFALSPTPQPRLQSISDGLTVAQIGWVDAPFALPGGGNILQLTVPILAECIFGVFLAVMEMFQDEVEETSQSATVEIGLDPEEEKKAEEKFNRSVVSLATHVASLRVHKTEILEMLCPPVVTGDSAEAVFKRVQELDAKAELRGKSVS